LRFQYFVARVGGEGVRVEGLYATNERSVRFSAVMGSPKRRRLKMQLDAYDRKILSFLQENNRISQRELAEGVNLSPSAVNRRIAALESAGVIKYNVSIVDPAAVGRPITVIVEVKLENERLDLLDEIKKRFVSCPQVQQVYYVTGDFDFLLVLNVKDMTEYEQLTRELFFFGNIKQFKTFVAMQNNKRTFAIPMDIE